MPQGWIAKGSTDHYEGSVGSKTNRGLEADGLLFRLRLGKPNDLYVSEPPSLVGSERTWPVNVMLTRAYEEILRETSYLPGTRVGCNLDRFMMHVQKL